MRTRGNGADSAAGRHGVTHFGVWAPAAREVAVVDRQRWPAAFRCAPGPADGGRLTSRRPVTAPTTRSSSTAASPTPDPRSLWQPNGVDAASRVYDHDRFGWSDAHWRGLALPGACSTSCTSARSPPRARSTRRSTSLDHLVDLGVDAVELLPVQRLRRPSRLGLRRGRPLRRARALRRPGRAEALRRRLPSARASAS